MAVVPVLSLSILRTVPHLRRFRDRFAEIGGAQFGTVRSGSTNNMAGDIHWASIVQHIFGDGVESIECMKGKQPMAYVHLDYGDRDDRPVAGVMVHNQAGQLGPLHYGFAASAYGPQGGVHKSPIGDFEYPLGAAEILKLCRQMVQTNKPPVPYEQIVENVAVVEVARLAYEQGRRIALSEIWRREEL